MAEPQALVGLTEGQAVEVELLVLEKLLHKTKAGAEYLALTLGDAFGQVPGRVWDDAARLDKLFAAGDVIRLKGRVNLYQGRKQLVLAEAVALDPAKVDLARFLPTTNRPVEDILADLDGLIATLAQPLRRLCADLYGDPAFREKFKRAPAAKAVHHAYLGGLAEHTLAVARLILLVAERYPFLHRDLLLAGALLHDAGKTEELGLNPAPDYTTAGRMVGHIVQGVRLIQAHLPPDFPSDLADEVIHLVLSHHGVHDFGSPKLPMTLEAVALNLCDDLDAKLNAVKALLDDSPEEWSAYSRLFERFFYQGAASRPALVGGGPSPQAPPARPRRTKPEPEPDPGLFGEL